MGFMDTKCFLVCLSGLHPPILLSHLRTLVLGRSKDTKIKSKRCSKSQVELTADYAARTVTVRQIGPNTSAVNQKPLQFGHTAVLSHNGVLEILQGEYPHKVEFEPTPDNLTESSDHTTLDSEMPRSTRNTVQEKRKTEDGQLQPKRAKRDGGEGSSKWEECEDGMLLVYGRHVEGRPKVASYDVDGTLITTKSGRVFATGYDDWKILYSEVPGKLKQLHKDGYKIVIFTNQAGIAAGKQTVAGIQGKLTNIFDKLGVPVQAFVSTGKGPFRKPSIAMWKYLEDQANSGVKINVEDSMYVGDAAGRPAQGSRKKDFSMSDRLFALNLGLPFFTPEEHFLGRKAEPFNMPEFDPRTVDDSLPLFDPPSTKVPKEKPEVVILVGYPGAGKSFVAQQHLQQQGFITVNRDTLGSWQKCIAVMEKALQEGKCVVVDNTNPDKESRKRYIDAVKKYKVGLRCFVFTTSRDHARHNNKFREFISTDHSKVSDMIYNMYRSKYEEPTLQEGFSEIVKVNFIPKFQSAKDEKLYRMFLLEK